MIWRLRIYVHIFMCHTSNSRSPLPPMVVNLITASRLQIVHDSGPRSYLIILPLRWKRNFAMEGCGSIFSPTILRKFHMSTLLNLFLLTWINSGYYLFFQTHMVYTLAYCTNKYINRDLTESISMGHCSCCGMLLVLLALFLSSSLAVYEPGKSLGITPRHSNDYMIGYRVCCGSRSVWFGRIRICNLNYFSFVNFCVGSLP